MKVSTTNLITTSTLSLEDSEKIAKTSRLRASGLPDSIGEEVLVATATKSPEESTRDGIAISNSRGALAYMQAGNAIHSITTQMSAIESAVKGERPSLSGKDWDFSLKDGKFVVRGDGLTNDDTTFIEDKLNGNQKLVQAAQSLVGAAVKSLQRTDDLQGGTTNSLYSGATRSLVFDNVAEQLNGAIDFKQFLAKNEDLATYHGKIQIEDVHRGFSALELLGSQLDSNVKAVGYSVFPAAR